MPNESPAREQNSAQSGHLASLDAYRGFVILTMIFVNYLAGIEDMPRWAKHLKADEDGYTFVDVVFSGFLFIVGVAIPLSLSKRAEKGESLGQILTRIFVRTAGLLFLGVIFVSQEQFDAKATGMHKAQWYLLALCSAVILWNRRPAEAASWRRGLNWALRLAAVLALAYLLIIFRGKNEAGEIVRIRPSWWGILGLIGWAYLICCLMYLLCRGDSTALMGVMGFMIALYIGSQGGVLEWLAPLTKYVGVGEVFGTLAAIVMAGVLVGNGFVGHPPARSPARQLRFIFFWGVGLYLAGLLLRPLHGGISKIHGTTSYALVTASVSCLLYLVFYYLVDLKGFKPKAGFLMTIGANALLAYVLPDIVSDLSEVAGFKSALWPYGSGWAGAVNAGVMTGLMLVLTWILTRLGVQLKL
jgi:predicted acyltransferase